MTPILSLWPSAATKTVAMKVASFVKEKESYSDFYSEVLCDEIPASELAAKIAENYRRLITLTMADTTLHIVGVLPLYENDALARLGRMVEACGQVSNKVSLHVMGLCSGLARVAGDAEAASKATGEAEKQFIAQLADASTKGDFRFSFTLIDDYAANGASLGFTLNSFSEYLALLFLALIRCYHSVLPPAMLAGDAGKNLAMGLSSLRFDREAACRYLLDKAFVEALGSAGINQDEVDAQKASYRAEQILKGISERYPAFFDKKVLPLYRDDMKDENEIVAEVGPLLAEEIKDLENELTAFLHSSTLSFPEKEGILALLLGRDNRRLRGLQYDRETLLLDDACIAPVNLYIDAFNSDDMSAGVLPSRDDFPKLKRYDWDSSANEYVESSENKYAFNPLPEIKRLKLEILNTTAFIRRKNDELADLLKAEEERGLLDKDTDGTNQEAVHKRFEREIKEQPLDETYHPSETLKPKLSADLRSFFSPIRDQKHLGSCTTFAVVSMYEAIMNRNSGGKVLADLSERFIYYYSNVLKGKPEGGSTYSDQLEVLGKRGVCKESLFGYSTDHLEEAPSAEAVDDAMAHRVLKALQIPLRNGADKAESLKENHRLYTSALTEGYPVGITLKVYDNFGKNGPFINRPDENDISSGDAGYHAMVLAGYSESDKCYIVRNSWGSNFGDKGYCYISAAYVDDPEYNPFACIITETTDDNTNGDIADVPQLVATFAGTESQIRIAAIRNVLDETNVILENLQMLYEENYRYYQRLLQRLCMPQVRKEIRQRAEIASGLKFQNLKDAKNGEINSLVSRLDEFKKNYIRTVAGEAIAALIAYAVAYYTENNAAWITALVLTGIIILMCAHYGWSVRAKRRQLNERIASLASEEERAKREFFEKQLRFHVAGMWIDRFHELSSNISRIYDRLAGFNSDLLVWQDESSRGVASLVSHEGQMFIYMADKDLLDAYYAANSKGIIANIDLMQAFDAYAANPESIQKSHDRLREATYNAIVPLFSGFSMVRFLMGESYPYVAPISLEQEINRLLRVGQASSRHKAAEPAIPTQLLLLDIAESQMDAWQTKITPLFPFRPAVVSVASPCSLDLVTIQPHSIDMAR